MPWSNQNGGGPWGGGNNGGNDTGKNGGSPWGGGNDNGNKNNQNNPWGKKPSGSGGGNGGPDLDDMLRKGQDKLRQAGGGGFVAIIVLAVLALWAYQCFYMVGPNQQAVELRFGVPKAEMEGQGAHFLFWPVEQVQIVSIATQTREIGGASVTRSISSSSSTTQPTGLMLTADQNIVNVRFTVTYRVSDVRSYLFNILDPVRTMEQVSESAMREVVGRRPVTDVYRAARAAIQDEVKAITQDTLDRYKAGIEIVSMAIETAEPPTAEVASAFDAVQQAEQEQNRARGAGQQYRNRVLGQARGRAAQIREAAQAYKSQVVEEATGETQRFLSLYAEASKARELTQFRLETETMEKLFSGPNKLFIGGGAANGILPYMPINEFMKQNVPVKTPASSQTQMQAQPQSVGGAK